MSYFNCAACGERTGGYGHVRVDADGGFYTCREPERAQRRLDARVGRRPT